MGMGVFLYFCWLVPLVGEDYCLCRLGRLGLVVVVDCRLYTCSFFVEVSKRFFFALCVIFFGVVVVRSRFLDAHFIHFIHSFSIGINFRVLSRFFAFFEDDLSLDYRVDRVVE